MDYILSLSFAYFPVTMICKFQSTLDKWQLFVWLRAPPESTSGAVTKIHIWRTDGNIFDSTRLHFRLAVCDNEKFYLFFFFEMRFLLILSFEWNNIFTCKSRNSFVLVKVWKTQPNYCCISHRKKEEKKKSGKEKSTEKAGEDGKVPAAAINKK